MRRFFSIFSFTFKETIRNKGFIISILITLVIFLGFANVDKILNVFSSGKASKVLVVSDSKIGNLNEKYVDSLDNKDYDFIYKNDLKDLDSEKAKIKSGDSDYRAICLVEYNGEVSGKIFVNKEPSKNLEGMIEKLVNDIKISQDIKKLNLTTSKYQSLVSPANVEVVQEGNSSNGRMALVYMLIFMIYGGMIGLGSMVATSVLEEKTSRIMESLITMAKPLELFFGKVFGICAVGIIQFGVVLGAGSFIIKDSTVAKEILGNANLDARVISSFIVFFLIGYLTFALLYGAVGSLATSMQDANGALVGITYIIIAVFFIAIKCLFNIDSTFTVIFSYLPFSSPLVMFERIILSDISVVQVFIGIVLNIAYILGIGIFSSKVYKRGTLHYGSKLSFVKLLKDIRK